MLSRTRITTSTIALLVTALGFAACGNDPTRQGFEGTAYPTDPGSSGGFNGGGDGGTDSAFQGCASATFKAEALPAAMLFVLDKSGTMADGGKYAAAQAAIAQAMDLDSFDSMHLGLLGYPSSNVSGPACLFGIPVLCGVSGLPQVPLALAGKDKSSASNGVRHLMYQWLVSNAPVPGNGDANPTYDALKNGLTSLKAWNVKGKRILFYITDGGASCASLSSRPGYQDGNGCPDWEHPATIVDLVKAAHDDTAKPVNTIVVGVPGADGHGENSDVPPYSVRLALSSYAAAGSPETIPATCTGKTFNQTPTDPTTSCHFDMTTGNYSANALAGAITQVRGKLLGCVYELPVPASGQLDKNQVNVHIESGGKGSDLYKRKDASNPCTADGCWDYTEDGKLVLVGKACEDVKGDVTAKVNIVVGCQTVVK